MCGIVAIVSSQPITDRDRIERALDAMESRGPDGRGRWSSQDGRVMLGHTRLAVRGLGSGAQPIENEDGSVVAVVNGELYGVEPLRRELERRGHQFKTRSDSELVVHLYEEDGDGLLERLRGELAFILVDRRRQRVLAARDAFGIKPMLVARCEAGWILASSCRAIFAAGVPARLDEGALFVALSLQYLPWRHSLFEGVEPLPPGHALMIENGELRRWSWRQASKVTNDVPDIEWATAGFAHRFEDAVRHRLDAEVPIAFQLSGGIDSAAVLATAAPHLPDGARAFTVSFPDRTEDELESARATAAHVGAELEVVAATPARLADAWPRAAMSGEGLAVNAHLPAKWLLAEAMHDAGIVVALTGEGADEVLYGYPHLVVDAGYTVTNEASVGLMLPDGDVPELDRVRQRLGFVPTFLRAKAGIGALVRPLLRPDFVEKNAAVDPGVSLVDGALADPHAVGRAPVDVAARLWSRLALDGYILRTLGDAMEMAHGIEGRLPFLDADVVDWLEPLPWNYKIHHARDKQLLRNAMRGVLPDALVERSKHPFVAPPLEGALYDVVGDALHAESFASQPAFVPEAARKLLEMARSGDHGTKKRLDPALWLVASVALLVHGLGVTS